MEEKLMRKIGNFYDDEIMCVEEKFMSQEEFNRMYVRTYEITFEAYNEGRPDTRKVIVRAYCVMDAINALCEDERMHITQIKKSPILVLDATQHSI